MLRFLVLFGTNILFASQEMNLGRANVELQLRSVRFVRGCKPKLNSRPPKDSVFLFFSCLDVFEEMEGPPISYAWVAYAQVDPCDQVRVQCTISTALRIGSHLSYLIIHRL